MPLPLTFKLTSTIKTAMPLVQSGVLRGLSANSILNSLKEAGLGFKRQNLQELVRYYKGVELTKPHLQNLKRTAFPNINRLPVAAHAIRRKLSFTVRVTGIFTPTGKPITQYITVATDDNMSREEIEQKALDALFGDVNEYPLEDIEVQIETGIRAGEAGLF